MYPKINEYLYLQVASSDAAESEIQYRARIADMEDESFLIEIPMHESNGRLKKLFVGDELSVYFLTEGGIKNYFNTHVLGFKEEVIRMVRLRKPAVESIFKMQRRSFFRVNAELELAVKDALGSRFLVRTEDIGGGERHFSAMPKSLWRWPTSWPAGCSFPTVTEARSMLISKAKLYGSNRWRPGGIWSWLNSLPFPMRNGKKLSGTALNANSISATADSLRRNF